jgi:predicted Fe-S protein YdhL (DUF1289 family)
MYRCSRTYNKICTGCSRTYKNICTGCSKTYKKICTGCSRTYNKIVPLTNLNKYLYNIRREIKANINKSSLKETLRLSVG